MHLPRELRQHQEDGLGRTGGRGNDIERRGPGLAQVFADHVEDPLSVRVGVHRRHEAALDPEFTAEHLRRHRERVCGAGSVADDGVFLRIIQLVVDAHVQRDVFPLGRCADDDFLCASGQVAARFLCGREAARGFDHQVRARGLPRDGSRLAFREHLDRPVIDAEFSIPSLDTTREGPIVGVVFEQMGICLQIGDVVERHDLEAVWVALEHRAKGLPANPSKPVNAYPH